MRICCSLNTPAAVYLILELTFDAVPCSRSHPKFQYFDNLSPVVSAEDCFDAMLVPKDHVSRRPTDTYYVNETTVLRAHTSAHEVPTMKQGIREFLVSGDVYRRDEIDASHYPVFHQMEGVRIFSQVGEWSCGAREGERIDAHQTLCTLAPGGHAARREGGDRRGGAQEGA